MQTLASKKLAHGSLSPQGARIKDAIAALVRALEWKAAAQVLKK